MKLAPTLAQYLRDRKKLVLPGIGIFSFDSSLQTEADSKHASQGISFQNSSALTDSDDLVNYISQHTGKQKSLASADFESYLELAKQFLNIGKPFHIEGIGTIVKVKGGSFEFTADHLLSDKVKETGIKELSATSISDQSLTTYESLKPQKETNAPYRKMFMIVLIAATTGIIVFLGYKIYKNNSTVATEPETTAEVQQPIQKDTTTTVSKPRPDTSNTNQTAPIQAPANGMQNYRFIIEEAGKNRALYRYNMLKKGGIPVQLSTNDSVSFKLFFVIPALPADTGRIADSLTIFYPAVNHKRAYAEK